MTARIVIVIGVALSGLAAAQPSYIDNPASANPGQVEQDLQRREPVKPVARDPGRISDGSHLEPRHDPGRAERPAPTDKRPYFVAIGILIIGAMFLWNRKQRAELERTLEEEATRRDRDAARAARDAAGAVDAADSDSDSADLRAAARGDDEERP